MKRVWKLVTAVFVLAALTVSTAFAAGWTTGQGENSSRWWYDLGNGQYYGTPGQAVEWQWLDGNGDGTAECYAFDSEGWMYAGGQTPDGYSVNGDGAWTVNGVVQTQNAVQGSAGEQTENQSRILVAYYTMPETEGTDTDSGASRVATGGQVKGNMEYMAGVIAQETGGKLFQVDTVQTYPGLHGPLVDQASEELDRDYRPALSTHIDNLDHYDVIFVGYPIWWGEMPMAMYSFFDEYDFNGKTVIPFSSHGGSGFSGTVSKIEGLEPSANVLTNGFTTSRENVTGSADSIRDWVRNLDLR